jgi:hypothetical protein
MRESAQVNLPFARSYWVIPDQVLAGYFPGSSDDERVRSQIAGLLECGIRRIVNLMEPDEVNYNGQPFVSYVPLLTSLGSNLVPAPQMDWFPIRDQSVPSDSQMVQILDHIDRSLEESMPVYVHCWGGKGRTGTVVGCYLARHGIAAGPHALDMIRQLRQNDPKAHEASPETEEQRQFVLSWKPAK